jgi:L-ascorbate metabolism protein UlaG (beta-lactamase superfamily)
MRRGAAVFVLLAAVQSTPDRFPATGGDIVITPSIHSSVQIEHAGRVIQVDPWSLGDLSRLKPADLILITDDVGHHLDVKAIAGLRKPGAPVIIAANGKSRVPDGIVLANGASTTITLLRGETAGSRFAMWESIPVEAVAAYDIKPGEPYHPKGEANGYVMTIGGKRIYIAGVTECVPEIRALKNVDIAFFPLNVPLERMEPEAAIECLKSFRPKVVYPYHYDQDWVAKVTKGAVRPEPSTRGLEQVRTALAAVGIDVRLATWYPR